ncbi:MAG: hypothetical protein RLZZ401_678 [Pseudomonadota bacterium]
MIGRRRQPRSIRHKLTWLVMAVVTLATLVVFGVSVLGLIVNSRASLATKISVMNVLGDVTALSAVSAVTFNDRKAAEEILGTLTIHPDILGAELTSTDGSVFASYTNPSTQPALLARTFPGSVTELLQRPLRLAEEPVGTLTITIDISGLWTTLAQQALVALAGLVLALTAGYLVLRRMSNAMLRPIERLAAVSRQISASQDYSLRAEKATDDELGDLTVEFNAMLDQIAQRDAQLGEKTEALAQTQEAICLTDAQARLQYVNPAFTKLLGYTLADILGQPVTVLRMADVSSLRPNRTPIDAVRTTGVFAGEIAVASQTGRWVPMFVSFSPIRDGQGAITGYVGAGHDISGKKQSEALIWKQANFDDLTGLPNRRMFQDSLDEDIRKASRTQSPLALLLLDLDGFKEVNDTLGHDMGDLLLKQAAHRLVKSTRSSDMVARIGGDEFTIIVRNIAGAGSLSRLADTLLHNLAEPFRLNDGMVYVSISIGIALYPSDSLSMEELLKHADQAMYEAKKGGRNCARYFTPSLQEAALSRMQITTDLRTALVNQQFVLFYQPIVDLSTSTIRKAEALIRWSHPTQGMIDPDRFIRIAEETGLIVDIGDWVFRSAASQVARWRVSCHPNFQISINKSPVQFRTGEDTLNAWYDHLLSLDLPGKSLSIEITEGLLMDHSRLVTKKLLQLRERGIEISLDDFGTGFSSLAYLNKFEIDFLKIDQSFVRNLLPDSREFALCKAIITMAHELGIKVIAEGIETLEQRDLLRTAGCDLGQGNLFSKPVPAAEFEALFAQWQDFSPTVLSVDFLA